MQSQKNFENSRITLLCNSLSLRLQGTKTDSNEDTVSRCLTFDFTKLIWKSFWCCSKLKHTHLQSLFQANSSNQEALMKHAQEENHFYSFSSFLYPTDQTHVTQKWLLAIGSKGRMRNASRVLRRHKSHQFQITEIRKESKGFDLSAFLRAIRTREQRNKTWIGIKKWWQTRDLLSTASEIPVLFDKTKKRTQANEKTTTTSLTVKATLFHLTTVSRMRIRFRALTTGKHQTWQSVVARRTNKNRFHNQIRVRSAKSKI